MNDPNEQLEQELRTVWQQAANTRKAMSGQRISRILKRSRAELSLRELFQFASFLMLAFVHLFGAVIQAITISHQTPASKPENNNHEPQ